MSSTDTVIALNNAYKFNKTFSGTDTMAFLMLPGCVPVWIGALTTISYSMFRNKKPVINIGRTNINGVTRGSRIYAGTMIFTLINQHWLRELCDQPEVKQWLGKYNELKADELPLFDIMIISANEYGNWCDMLIYGIDVTDEAQTVSVEDLFTENTLSFVARDISTFKMVDPIKGKSDSQDSSGNTQREPVTEIVDMDNISIEDIEKIENEFKNTQYDSPISMEVRTPTQLSRDLYYSSSDTIMGNDVSELQSKLNQLGYNIEVNGKFDSDTDEAVKKYQSEKGLEQIDGVVDNALYTMILQDTIGEEEGRHMACVVNKDGAMVYRNPTVNSDIIDVIPYKSIVEVSEIVVNQDNDRFERFYKTNTGYILEADMYSFLSTGSIIEFPKIVYGDSNSYVTLVQQALSTLYSDSNIQITGEYSDADIDLIKRIQREHGLNDTGEVDNETWRILYTLDSTIINNQSMDGYRTEYQASPGTYQAYFHQFANELPNYRTILFTNVSLNVKVSVVTEYEDGYTSIFSYTQTISNSIGTTIGFERLQRAFIYHPEHGVPVKSEMIIQPYNKKTLKWIINFISQGGM